MFFVTTLRFVHGLIAVAMLNCHGQQDKSEDVYNSWMDTEDVHPRNSDTQSQSTGQCFNNVLCNVGLPQQPICKFAYIHS